MQWVVNKGWMWNRPPHLSLYSGDAQWSRKAARSNLTPRPTGCMSHPEVSPRLHEKKCTSRWEAKSGPKEWTSCSEIDVFKQPRPNKHLKNVAEPSGSISSHWRPVKRLPKRWEKKNQGGLNFLIYLKTRKNIGLNSHTACKHPEDDKDISLDGLVKNRCVKSI